MFCINFLRTVQCTLYTKVFQIYYTIANFFNFDLGEFIVNFNIQSNVLVFLNITDINIDNSYYEK